MKVLKYAFLLLIAGSLFSSCQKDCCDFGDEIVTTQDSIDQRGTATLNGVVNCINGDPKEGVSVKITDTDGNVWNETTDANGQFLLNDMPNVEYTIEFDFVDDDATAYTLAEAQQILLEMKDFILGINSDFQLIDALVYDANDSGALTTLDIVLFEKRYVERNPSTTHPIWDWRFIAVEESQIVTSNSFNYPSNLTIQMYQPNATADLEYIAVRVGDRHGVACDNTPPPPPVSGMLTGVVNCIEGTPKEGVTVNIIDPDGNIAQEITDAEGQFSFETLPNKEYSLEFDYSDVDADAYSDAEAQEILDNMMDIILGVNQDVKPIDELIYDVNENGSITTFDHFLFEKRYVKKEMVDPDQMWIYKFIEMRNPAFPLVDGSAVRYPSGQSIDGYQSNTTTDLEFIIIRAADRAGVSCDN